MDSKAQSTDVLFCRVKFNYKCLTKMRHDKCVIDLVYAIEGLITWRISARAEVSARVTGLKKNAITWEISVRAERTNERLNLDAMDRLITS